MNIKDLKEIKEKFEIDYDYLWCSKTPGGINSVGIGAGFYGSSEYGLMIGIQGNQQVLDQIPDIFLKAIVYKKMIGEIKAL